MTVMIRCCLLGAVLLLPVGVAAGEIKQATYQGNICEPVNRDKWRCGAIDGKQLIVSVDKQQACYAKMREAMKAFDRTIFEAAGQAVRRKDTMIYLKSIFDALDPDGQWKRTMKECVEGE
jgi:hypothetical protein